MSQPQVVAWFDPANPNNVLSAAQFPHVLEKNKVGYLPCIVHSADLERTVERVLDAWDSSPLPKANDGLMQECMEALRQFAEPPAQTAHAETTFEKSARWGWPDGRPDL